MLVFGSIIKGWHCGAILDFMQNGALCMNRTAHNALVEVVDVNALSELFDQQEQLYCDWLKNTETKYESNYVPYPQESCR